MGGSHLGLTHLYAEAQHADFVREAENWQVTLSITPPPQSRFHPLIQQMRAVAGGVFIGIGVWIKGNPQVHTVENPAAGLRLAP